MYDLTTLRHDEFPLSKHTLFVNHASISPIPQRSQRKIVWAAAKLAENPSQHFQDDVLPMTEQFQTFFCDYLNAASPHEVIPITSTSSGLNAVAQALPLQAGDNICLVDGEFPSNVYPWMSLERDGVEVRLVPPINGGLTLDALAANVDARTRVVAASAVQFFTGHRTDLAAIGAFCQAHDIWFVVDAIQAIGHFPIDVQAMHIDILASGGQKSIMAPPGIGVLYVREGLAAQMQPRAIGPNATEDFLHWLNYDLTLLPGAERFTAGTSNFLGLFGIMESAGLLQELGLANIEQHTTQLAANLLYRLRNKGYNVITPPEEHAAIITFASPYDSPTTDAWVAAMQARQVFLTKHIDKQGLPHLRCALHCYNTEEEIVQLIDIIEDSQP